VNPSEQDLINQIQQEERKYQEVIKNDDLFKEAKKIRQRVKALKEKLIKLFLVQGEESKT
jgi:protein-arginine kinase activator protein McsA